MWDSACSFFTKDNSGDLCLMNYGPTDGLEENPTGDQDQGSDVICQNFSPFACSCIICRAFMYNYLSRLILGDIST